MAPRDRLLILARRAGYSPTALERLAEATLPRYVIGERLDDGAVAEVCLAVEVFAQSAMTDQDIPVAVADYKAQWGEQWRERFWRAYLRIASWRFNHPELYGPSPCDLPAPLELHAARVAPATVVADVSPAAEAPAVDDEPPPSISAEREPLPPGFVAPAPAMDAAVAAPISSPEIHPAVAAAPVLRRTAA